MDMCRKNINVFMKCGIESFSIVCHSRGIFKWDELTLEIAHVALPAALALAADPIASLVDTAFIGQIGAIELAAVGVSIALFNQVSRIAIFPLVSITTSFVAQEDAIATLTHETKNSKLMEMASGSCEQDELIPKDGACKLQATSHALLAAESGKKCIPSASSALIIGGVLGMAQALFLMSGAEALLGYMGISSDSPMMLPARKYLTLRSLGAPAVLLSLAMQGIFRGFKDTKTPLFAIVIGDMINIILDLILMFVFHLGIQGAAIAHVISQYLISMILLWRILEEVNLLPPSVNHLHFGQFLKNGSLLLLRVLAATLCVTIAAALAAREGSISMAAFQVCLQVWLATSLLADGLAVAGQAIIANAFALKNHHKATNTASRVLQMGVILGLILAVILALLLHFGAWMFTSDANVRHLISIGTPFIAGTQPINAISFVFDGINFGASDFAYSACSMVLVAIVAIISLMLLSYAYNFIGLWVALTLFMSLRAFAGFWRIGTRSGPWNFLRN